MLLSVYEERSKERDAEGGKGDDLPVRQRRYQAPQDELGRMGTRLPRLRRQVDQQQRQAPLQQGKLVMTNQPKIDLTEWDVIAVSSSGGKDSQAMLHEIATQADAAGVLDRVVVIHSDLGRVEWEGTLELAKRQAERYGVRFMVVTRIGQVSTGRGAIYAKGEVFGDLLDYTERRAQNLKDQGSDAPSWPSNTSRYCTSEFKRGPIQAGFTKLAKEWKAASGEQRACRVLDCQGLRAQESAARAKRTPITIRKDNRNQFIMTWLPILDWTESKVWDTIKSNGLEYHKAYDLGMPRLSCAFCIFASKDALMVAGIANPELLAEYVAVEERTGHTFKADSSLADIKAAIERGEQPDKNKLSWAQCA